MSLDNGLVVSVLAGAASWDHQFHEALVNPRGPCVFSFSSRSRRSLRAALPACPDPANKIRAPGERIYVAVFSSVDCCMSMRPMEFEVNLPASVSTVFSPHHSMLD